MKPETEKYIELAKVLKEQNLDNTVIAAIIQEVAKDIRMSIIREEKDKDKETRKNLPATEKQKAFLDKSEIQYKPDITLGEASDLISAKIAKKD